MSKKWNKVLLGVIFVLAVGFALRTKIALDSDSEVTSASQESPSVLEVEDVVLEDVPVDEESFIESSSSSYESSSVNSSDSEPLAVYEDGSYNSKDEVALYIFTYSHLPDNYITKKEAQSLGWLGGSLEPYAPGKSIGGDRFGNREGILPKKNGRNYKECDIDTVGKASRGAKRIVFSNDGLIYYTEDHYDSFEMLYGDE
ncbi:MAG: hypothetical protein K6G00_12055 [Treponema sp.]|nr:hypothetical protein [Treponema sp.]